MEIKYLDDGDVEIYCPICKKNLFINNIFRERNTNNVICRYCFYNLGDVSELPNWVINILINGEKKSKK